MPVLRGRRFGPSIPAEQRKPKDRKTYRVKLERQVEASCFLGGYGLWLVGFWAEVLLVMSNSNEISWKSESSPTQKQANATCLWFIFFMIN